MATYLLHLAAVPYVDDTLLEACDSAQGSTLDTPTAILRYAAAMPPGSIAAAPQVALQLPLPGLNDLRKVARVFSASIKMLTINTSESSCGPGSKNRSKSNSSYTSYHKAHPAVPSTRNRDSLYHKARVFVPIPAIYQMPVCGAVGPKTLRCASL